MTNVIISLIYDHDKQQDLALPVDVPCFLLAEALAQALNFNCAFNRSCTIAKVELSGTRSLPDNATLAELGIKQGDILRMRIEKPVSGKEDSYSKAFLRNTQGKNIPLRRAYLLIGRRDPVHNILPDIDLADLDSDKVSSRRHACLQWDGSKYTITDLGSVNGTWINGKKLAESEKKPLTNGDSVLLGSNGVLFTFIEE